MNNKNSMFFNLDILSYSPKLRIFGNYNYKTTWSTIISILVLTFSFGFALYSSLKYFHFENPNIYYYKNSIYNKTISLNLNEILLMFKIGESFENKMNNFEDVSLKAYIYNFNFNSSYEYNSQEIRIEKCELYKNINSKFNTALLEYENKNIGKSLNDFYCINKEDAQKYSLYNNQSTSYNYLSIVLYNNDLNKKSDIPPESLRIYLILENDFVIHNNRDNPIFHKYIETFSSNFNDGAIETTVFDLDYIEYDSDDGHFFEEINTYKGIRLSRESQEIFFLDNPENNYIGRIKIRINRNTFDKYIRNYMKIQELLSEIESIINIFFIVGRILANVIDRKKMNVDLGRVLMNQKIETDKDYNKLFEKNNNLKITLGKRDNINSKNKIQKFNTDKPSNSVKIDKINPTVNTSVTTEIEDKDSVQKENNIKYKNNNLFQEKVMKKIHIYHILKSYLFCFNDKKTKLINLYNNIILDELNIDKILSRIFKLEKIYYLLSEEDKAKINLIPIKELDKIKEYVNDKFVIPTEEMKL